MGHFEVLIKLLKSKNVKANSSILIKRKLRNADISKLQNAGILLQVKMITLQKYYNVKQKSDQICIRVLRKVSWT